MKKALFTAALLIAGMSVQSGRGQEALVAYKVLSPDTALELAQAALEACRAKGFQVAVAVVDRFGQPQVMLRDRFAGPHTPSTATNKGWTAVSFRANTSDLIGFSQPGQPQAGIRNLPNVVVLGGGVLIEGAGAILGAVGVSGAPGGAEDDHCAKAGIDAVRDKLEL
jgi:uncharacterized protein GlcG (DUF336 family)